MPTRVVDNKTGFVQFTRTPEERDQIAIKEENERLRAELEDLKKVVGQLVDANGGKGGE